MNHQYSSIKYWWNRCQFSYWRTPQACSPSHSWWRHQMEFFFALLAPLCGEFTGHRWIPLTKANDAELGVFWGFFYLRLNKRLSKQSWGWWFQTPSRSLWHDANACLFFSVYQVYTYVINCFASRKLLIYSINKHILIFFLVIDKHRFIDAYMRHKGGKTLSAAKQNTSLRRMLKIKGPTIDPYGR